MKKILSKIVLGAMLVSASSVMAETHYGNWVVTKKTTSNEGFDANDDDIDNVGQISADSVIADGSALAFGGGTETVAIDSSDWDISNTGAITNAEIDLANNTFTGTMAEFDAAVSDGTFEYAKQQIVTVAKDGGQFTSIQSAIDSITDNSSSKRYVVLIGPGEYTENVVMEEYVSLLGYDGAENTVITATSGTTLTGPPSFSGVTVANLEIENTGNNGIVVSHTQGVMTFMDGNIKWDNSTNGDLGQCLVVDATAGPPTIFSSHDTTFIYDAEGDAVGANTHNIIEVDNDVELVLNNIDFKFDISDQDDDARAIYAPATATLKLTGRNIRADLEMLSATYSGTACFFHSLSEIEEQFVEVSHISMTSAGNGDGALYFLDSPSGGLEMDSQGNAISVTGFANNYFINVATGDTVNSSSDSVVAAEGVTGAGTVEYAGTSLNGDLNITQDVNAAYVEFNDASNTYIGLSKAFPTYFAFENDYTNFWLGNSGDQNIWMNYEKDADIFVGSGTGGDTNIQIHEGTDNYTILDQDGVDFKIQQQATNGDIILEPNGTGNVGIGTSSPDQLLHLAGQDNAVIRFENTDTSLIADQIIGSVEFEKQDASGAGIGVVGGIRMRSEGSVGESTYLTVSTSNSSTNDNEVMRINSSGDVGIGTDSPLNLLHIQSTSGGQQRYGREDATVTNSEELGTISFGATQSSNGTGASIRAQAAGSWGSGDTGGELIFRTVEDGTSSIQNRMIITDTGDVGIGIDAPGATLDVDGGITAGKVTADPCAGSGYEEGSIFYNDTSNYYCFCDGTNDVQLHSPATACF